MPRSELTMEDEHEGDYDGYMGAIFMSNRKTKEECFHWKIFGLPHTQAHFVAKVKTGMILFLFEYEERKLYGVFEATSDGAMNIVPNAFARSGMSYPAQIHFKQIWTCDPLCEDEFGDAIKENYFTGKKFHFGLSYAQVIKLIRLFAAKRRSDPLWHLSRSFRNKSEFEGEHNYHRNEIDDIEHRIHDENDSNGYNGFSSQSKSSSRFVDASYQHGFYTSNQGPHQGLTNVIHSPSHNEIGHRRVFPVYPGEHQILHPSGLPIDDQKYMENLVGCSRSPIENRQTRSRSLSNQSRYGLDFNGLPFTDHLQQDLNSNQEAFSRFTAYERRTPHLSFVEQDYCPNVHDTGHPFVERSDPADLHICHSRTTKFAAEERQKLGSFHALTKPSSAHGYSEAFQLENCSGEPYNELFDYIPLSDDIENVKSCSFPSSSEALPASKYKSSKIKKKSSYKTVRKFHPSNCNDDYMPSEMVGRTIYSDSLSNGGRDDVFSRLSKGPPVDEADVYEPDTKISFDQFVDLLSQRRTKWNKMGNFRRQLPVKDFNENFEDRFVKKEDEAASADTKQDTNAATGLPFVNFRRRSEVRKSDGETKCNEHVGGVEAKIKRRKLIRPVLDNDETLFETKINSVNIGSSEKNTGSCKVSKGQNDGDTVTKGFPVKCIEQSENHKATIDFLNDINTYVSQTGTESFRNYTNKADSDSRLEELSTMNGAGSDECALVSNSSMNAETMSLYIVDEESKHAGLTGFEIEHLKGNSKKEPDCSTKNKTVVSDKIFREEPPAMLDPNCAIAADESFAVEEANLNSEIYSTNSVATYVSKDQPNASDGEHGLCSESQQKDAGNALIVKTSLVESPRKHGDLDPVVLDIGNKAFSFTVEQMDKNSADYLALGIGLS